jgi:hypothetical protein
MHVIAYFWLMKIFLSIVLCVFSPILLTAGVLPSAISSNLTLDIKGSPYLLTGNVTIAKGVSVVVNPGVKIQSSPTGNYGIMVNGELKMLGKKDSIINLDSVYIQFNAGSAGYNSKTKTGSSFSYVRFNCAQNGSTYAIRTNKASVYASHCQFNKVGYAIYAISDSVNITLYQSKIIGQTNGYSVYNTYKNWNLDMLEDTIINGGYLYMAANNRVEKCLFLGGTNTYYGLYGQSHTKTATIACNYFNRIYYGINLSSLSNNHGQITLYKNVVDSSYYGAFFSRDFNSDSVIVSNNAFLKCDYAIYCLTAINATPSKRFTCINNWWGTTDTTKIKGIIYDHKDNSMVVPDIVTVPMLTSPPVLCGPTYGNYGTLNNRYVTKPALNIGPNPASDYLNLNGEYTGPAKWILSDMQGKIIQEGNIQLPGRIENLNQAGLFILKIQAPGTAFVSEKIMVIK